MALRSKSYWGYDDEFLEACRRELTLSAQEVDSLVVRLAEDPYGCIAGFYALDTLDHDEGELRLFFVDVAFIGTGVGRLLFDDLMQVAHTRGLRFLRLDADPGAAPFYERLGAQRVGDVESSSVPGRLLPSFQIHVELPPT